MKNLYVVTSNLREFNHFCSRVTASTLYTPVYISSPDTLRGLRKQAYTYLHDWRKVKNLDTIQHMLATQEMVFVAATAIVLADDEYWQEVEDESR